jgi:biotin carboxylase
MPHVVFAVPFAMDATLRFVHAACDLAGEGVRLGVVSQEPIERFPESLRSRLHAFHRVANAMDPEQLTDGVRAIAAQMDGRIDRLIGILEPLQEALAHARDRLGIPGMREDAAVRFRDKALMKDVLRQNGLPCAGHRLCTTAEEALAFGRSSGFPLVVKPPAGAGAKNTFRVDNASELEGYLRSMPPHPRDPVLLEEFLAGEEFSFDSVSLGGEHVFHSITEYTPTPLTVMQNDWIQWTVLLPRDIGGPEFEAIREAGPRSLEVLGMDTGITHMEWFRRDDGSIAISEVAARPPGAQFTTLLGYAHDRDFYEEWVRIVAFDRFDPPERLYATGAAFLRGHGAGRVQRVRGIEEAQNELGAMVVEAKLPRQGQQKASSYEGEGYVILRDPDTDRVREGLQRLVTLMQVEIGE